MATWENELKKAINKATGGRFYRRSSITSSTITTTNTAISQAATGRLKILSINLQTDGTGLAGGTNFQITRKTGGQGAATLLADAISGLGANVTHDSDSPTSGTQPSVTNNLPAVLEAGDVLGIDNTVSAGTGAGTIVITVEFERIDDNADIAFINA